jgi:hypothetical protein
MKNNLTNKKIWDVNTHASGPTGRLPLQPDFLTNAPSGDIFGWTQDAAMGWSPSDLGKDEYLILSTQGGIRAEDGSPIALGYHTGHYEVSLLAQAAAKEFKSHNTIPFAGFVSDPCDGRTQGTSGKKDSLAYRNDAATVLRRLIRSLPTRKGVLGIATCDKGLPAMMIALLKGVMVRNKEWREKGRDDEFCKNKWRGKTRFEENDLNIISRSAIGIGDWMHLKKEVGIGMRTQDE